jgi:hypothetical protein
MVKATGNLRCSRVFVAATARGDLANKGFVNGSVAHGFHHCQMLQVIVRLEQGIAGEELDENASYAPDVARKAPSEVEDDLGSAVVSGRDDGRVILVIKGSRTKVDESNLGVQQYPTELCRARIRVGRRRNVAVIREGLVVVLYKEDVLRFEISVDEIKIMQDCKEKLDTGS